MSEPKSDEEIVEEFRTKFQREDGLINKYFYLDNPESDHGYDVLSTPDAIADWLRTTLAAVRRKERIACIQQIEQMRDQPLTQRDARDICNLIVNVLTPTQDDTNLST